MRPFTRWLRWVRAIGVETSKAEIVRHIQEHATVDLNRDVHDGKLDDWLASMYNLLGVFQAVHFEQMRQPKDLAEHMNALLQRKWEENPTKFTPPP